MKDQNLTLREFLKQNNIKLIEIANVFGVTRGTIRDRFENPVRFTVEEIDIIARLVNKTPSSILRMILREVSNPDLLETFEEDEDK